MITTKNLTSAAVCVCVCVCVCVHACMHVCMYVCMYVSAATYMIYDNFQFQTHYHENNSELSIVYI